VDWSTRWRDGLGSRSFGRLTVMPSWAPPAERAGPLVVLDPETAFGSGEHGSTRVALVLLERFVRPGDLVLDLGSGSGILAIAAVKLGAARAIAVESDAEANPVAARNVERNDVAAAVEILEGDAGDLAPLLGPADLVLSNILRTVNTALLPAIASALRPGGIAIFSGMEVAEAPLFVPPLEAAGFAIEEPLSDTGWWGVAARRR
jgi:ribosomal protein L11 methyltransferase